MEINDFRVNMIRKQLLGLRIGQSCVRKWLEIADL